MTDGPVSRVTCRAGGSRFCFTNWHTYAVTTTLLTSCKPLPKQYSSSIPVCCCGYRLCCTAMNVRITAAMILHWRKPKTKRSLCRHLSVLQEHALYGTAYQMAFPGKKNHLLRRVTRILNNKNKTLGPAEKVFFMMGIVILSVIVATAAIAQIKTVDYVSAKKKIDSILYTTVPAIEPVKAPKSVETGKHSRASYYYKYVKIEKTSVPWDFLYHLHCNSYCCERSERSKG